MDRQSVNELLELIDRELSVTGRVSRELIDKAISLGNVRAKWAAIHVLIDYGFPPGHIDTRMYHELLLSELIGALTNRTTGLDEPTGFEAAAYIARYFCTLCKSDPESFEIEETVTRLAEHLRSNSNERGREALLLGCFEHIVSNPTIDTLLKNWEKDPVLGIFLNEARCLTKKVPP